MANGYQHLSDQERAVILSERSRGSSARAIGRLLGRSPSTVTRELARGSDPAAEAAYCPTQGARASANHYTVIETARVNGLEPHAYLEHLFRGLPTIDRDNPEGLDLLPWNVVLES
ncbi:MAG: helix-turn-helix domain-containing protein [Halorhodospira sp.]